MNKEQKWAIRLNLDEEIIHKIGVEQIEKMVNTMMALNFLEIMHVSDRMFSEYYNAIMREMGEVIIAQHRIVSYVLHKKNEQQKEPTVNH